MLKIIRGIILITLFLLPLFWANSFVYSFTVSKILLFYVATQLVFFTWLWLVYKKEVVIPKKVLFGVWTLYLISLSVASYASGNFDVAWWSTFDRMHGILLLLHVLLFSIVSASVFNKETVIKPIKAIVLSGGIVAFLSYLGPIGFNMSAFSFSPNAASTLGNTSYEALFLLFPLSYAVYLYCQERKWWQITTVTLITLSPLFVGYSTTFPHVDLGEARAGTVSLLVGAAVAGIAYTSHKLLPFKKAVLVVTLLLLLIASSGVYLFAAALDESSAVNQVFVENGGGTRVVLWQQSLEMIKAKPLLGWGWENFPHAFQTHFSPNYLNENTYQEIWFDRPHNFFLGLLVAGGAVTLTTFLLFIGTVFYNLLTLLKSHPLFSAMGIGLLVAYLLQIGLLFESAAVLPFFGFFISLIAIYSYHAKTT